MVESGIDPGGLENYEPSPQEIAALCAELQLGWSEKTKASRRLKVPRSIRAPAYVRRLAEIEIEAKLEERRQVG